MGFSGAWQVTEYVYNPDGGFAGIVHQRRELERLSAGRLRVTQHCWPGQELAGHLMGRFSGKPVFEMEVAGRLRSYRGPAVLGSGLSWGDDALLARGVWPEFGHNFSSFSLLPETGRQLTGGKFFNAGELLAHIVGVAKPVEDSGDWPGDLADHGGWPKLGTDYWPGQDDWWGTSRRFGADGSLLGEQKVHRRYAAANGQLGWEERSETGPAISVGFGERDGHYWARAQSTDQYELVGPGKCYGPFMEVSAYGASGLALEMLDLFDEPGGCIAGVRRWRQDGQPAGVDIVYMRAGEIGGEKRG